MSSGGSLDDLLTYGLGRSADSPRDVVIEEEQQEPPPDPRSLLTQEQVDQFRDIFFNLDEKGTGKIPTKLLGTIFRSLGYNPTKAQIKQYMAKADPDGKGLMDFQGFLLPIAENIDVVPETIEDLMQAFSALDENDLGYIPTPLLYEILTTHGEYLEDFEIDLLIKMADPKGEGRVVYEDFLDRMIGQPKKKGKGKK